MKEHSGNGKATNNDRDPTLDEHRDAGGHRQPARVPGDDDSIGMKGDEGEHLSPSARGRGEVSRRSPAAPIDVD